MVGRDQQMELLYRTLEGVTTKRRPPPGDCDRASRHRQDHLTREFVGLVQPSGAPVCEDDPSRTAGPPGTGRSPTGQGHGGDFRDRCPGRRQGEADGSGHGAVRSQRRPRGCGPPGPPNRPRRSTVPIANRCSSARRFVEELASRQPLLLVFEDIHWADASQLDLLESLASRARDVPVMFLALARPELMDSRPTWGAGLTSHTSMQLYPLSAEEARTLAGHLLPMLRLRLRAAADRVVITAEGNPLFIEELVASLAERVDEATEELPTNVRTTIAARLDTLPAAARGALLDAAVIGKVFWRGSAPGDRATRSAAELEDALDMLEARDFIRRESGARSRATTNTCSDICSSGGGLRHAPSAPEGSGTPR